ncbi:unnamed protein product, partial [Mesorhabditis belari]|uniref:Epidermal growth factor receptor substrate 15-like 1 n=1 Tax=Mesorhabditis belari TaxID=2138241 RepID=A0AAF3F4P9_9BILA
MSVEDLGIAPHLMPIYEGLYREMNVHGHPTVAAGDAASYLRGSSLPVQSLGQIWEIADYAKRGALDKRGAFIAFKLVAAAQQGHPIVPASVGIPGLNAPMLGSRTNTPALSADPGSLQASPSRPSGTLPRSPSGGGQTETWGIQPNDQSKYDSIFESLGPENGKLSGNKVRPVLLNSGLAPNVLAKIWELADQDKDGQLDRVEMSVALHLVYRALQNESVPNMLPNSLIHPTKAALSRRTSVASHHSAQDQYSTQMIGRNRTASLASLDEVGFPGAHGVQDPQRSFSVQPPYGRHGSVSGTPIPSQEWPVDVAEATAIFHRCDTNKDGLVSGVDVMGEFLRSGLSQPTLAHIWGLADTHANGMLNPEQFALAMHLVSMARSGQDLPSTLPPHLMPPSMRQLHLPNDTEPAPTLPTSTSQHLAFAAQSDNPEVKKLAEEMEALVGEKREAEAKITQLEADMTVKNSEIRNLQIELTTLENTVKQLERQKIEAGKRLGDLDTQIQQLDEQCRVQKEKVDEGQNRLEKLKEETENGAANAQRNTETLAQARAEVIQLENEARALAGQLQSEKATMERAVTQITTLERESDSSGRIQAQMEDEKQKIIEATEKLKKVLESENPEESLATQPELFANFKTPDMFNEAAFTTPSTSVVPPRPAMPNGNDPFAGRDPFASAGAAQSMTGFGSDPFGAAPGGAPGRPAPPRPAPPRASPAPASQHGFAADPFAGQDPFGGAQHAAGGAGFADFSNFN